jgi:hypothetical protein
MLLLASFAIGLASAARASFVIGALTVNRKTHLEMLLGFAISPVLRKLCEILNWQQLRLALRKAGGQAFSSPIGLSGAGQDLLRRSMMHTPPVMSGDRSIQTIRIRGITIRL